MSKRQWTPTEKQARDERIRKARRKPADELPPHSVEAEQGALGCILLAATYSLKELNLQGSMAQVDAMLTQLHPAHFYDLRHATLFDALRFMRTDNNFVDLITLHQWLKDKNQLEPVGGLSYISSLPDATPSVFNFPAYLAILREKRHRRWLMAKSVELNGLATAQEVSIEDTQARLAELYEATSKASDKRGELKIWRVNELVKYEPPSHLSIVGDNEIRMGYEGVTLIAGPGSSGKSLAVSSLALAGVIGSGTWQGRTVHRAFKTLVIQAENGAARLKKEIAAMQAKHPGLNFHDSIFISDPPEGGIPFHRSEFRQSVRRQVDALKPDVVIIDPWSHVAVEDAAKEVVDKIAEIRSCFPPGDACPALVIVAHTKKPRAEDVRRGRALAYLISGSIALVNTARCVFMLLPWSEDLEDDRIYWACCKLNDGQMYPASVWHRRFGTFFEHDDSTDPTTWGEEADDSDDRKKVTKEMVETVFKESKRPGMKRGELVKAITKRFDVGESTVWRAIKTYASDWLNTAAGVVALKKGKQ